LIVHSAITTRVSPAHTATYIQDRGSYLCFCHCCVSFQPHLKGDSETALTKYGCALSSVVKNSTKELFYN